MRRVGLGFAACGLAFGLIACAPAKKAPPRLSTVVFKFTGGPQSFTVPAGIDWIAVDAFGAQGAAGYGDPATPGGAAGLGGRAAGRVTVLPGTVLEVNVGGRGGRPGGGFNGGGPGTPDDVACTVGPKLGSGGGGASDVRPQGGDIASAWIVAAGGGGGVVSSTFGTGGNGGSGGGATGADGGDGIGGGGAQGGRGATESAGGDGGTGRDGDDGMAGAALVGGRGGGGVSCGGGGGGGRFGGGGGEGGEPLVLPGAGGGGGSGFGPPGTVFGTGLRAGDGQVAISFVVP